MDKQELGTRLRQIGKTKAELARAFRYRDDAAYNWGAVGRPVPPGAVALLEAWEEIATLRAAFRVRVCEAVELEREDAA